MKVAENSTGGERNTVAKIENHLVLMQPHNAGESITKFSNGEPSPWVDCHVWFVGKDGTPTPIGDDGGTAVRVWSEVLVPELRESIGEFVGARIIRPGSAYLFDELDEGEIGRCERAEQMLNVGIDDTGAF
jgi:hypothetical protein